MTSTAAIRPSPVLIPKGYGAAPSLEEVRTNGATLRRGQAGESVRQLQDQLIALGLLPATQPSGRPANDGLYGAATERAVRTFQAQRGLKDDGVVGSKTAAALLPRQAAPKGKDQYTLGTGSPGGKLGPEQVTIPDYRTPGGTLIHAVPNHYEPKTSPQQIIPRDPKLLGYLEGQETAMGKATDQPAAEVGLTRWAEAHPKVLEKLGIEDLRHLSPRQAIALSQEVSTDLIEWAPSGTLSKDRPIDEQGLHQVLEARRAGDAEKGACRNFAEAAQATFQTLKAMQDPATDRLRNTYAVDNSGGGHRTCAFVTLESSGKAVTTIVDPAWNNHDTLAEGGKGATDYTFHRAYNDATTSIRYGYFLRNLADGIGDREQAKFLSAFDRGGTFGLGRGDRRVTLGEVEKGGGLGALNQAIEALPRWSQGSMLATLEESVLVALNNHRGEAGLPPFSWTSGANNLQYHSGQAANVKEQDRLQVERYRQIGLVPRPKKLAVGE